MKHIFYYPPLRIAIIILALGIGAYFAVIAIQAHAQDTGLVSSSSGTPESITSVASQRITTTNNQVLLLLRSLSVIDLDDTLFRNPAFGLLSDQSVSLPAITTQGRRNPFAPIGSGNGVTAEIIETPATETAGSGPAVQ